MHKVLNALMASHCFSYPFSWFQGHPVEPAKSLHGKGEEGDPLVPGLSSPLHLALKCLLRGTPRLSISTFDWTRVRRPRNGHIKGPVFAVNSASNQDVTWASCNTFYWGKSSIGSRLVKNIAKLIMPGDPEGQVLSLTVSAAA